MLGIMAVMLAVVPRSSAADLSLALSPSDYPQRARIVALPSTNAELDTYLGPVHRSTFEHLHRLDGVGWLQAAIWHFKTGRGGVSWRHRTIFAYAINIFHHARQARQALADVKLKVRRYRLAHLQAWLFRSSGAHSTLIFHFFVYHNIEVEAYYEYRGVAPVAVAKSLHHIFSRQSSHLVHLTRMLSKTWRATPTPSPVATPTATPSPTPTATPTAAPIIMPPTATPTLIATATATATLAAPTATPAATSTSVPAGFQVVAAMAEPTYQPGDEAKLSVKATMDGQASVGARLTGNFYFGRQVAICTGVTDSSGSGSCSVLVPDLPDGTPVTVSVQVTDTEGHSILTSVSFKVVKN